MKLINLLVVLAFVFVGCSKVTVTTDYDSTVDFSALKTYSWLPHSQGSINDVRVADPQVDLWVRTAVDKNMAQRGFKAVAAGNETADFLVVWFGAIEKKVKQQSIDHFYSTYGYGPVGAKMPDKLKEGGSVREYEEGTLLLDFLDPETKKTIWRGSSTDTLRKGMSENEAELYVVRLIGQMLKSFPKM